MAHRPICEIPNCVEHYACRLRSKGLQVSPKAQSTRTLNWRPTKSVPPARNKELMYSERPDGSRMPILKMDGEQLRRKEYDEKRSKIDSIIRQTRDSGLAS